MRLITLRADGVLGVAGAAGGYGDGVSADVIDHAQ